MDDVAAKLTRQLEDVVTRIRGMTVDRAARVIRLITLGIVAAALGLMAAVFLFLTVYGALEIPLTPAGAFAVLGGLFLIGGAFIWVKRTQG